MNKIYIFTLLLLLFFSCSRDNTSEIPTNPGNTAFKKYLSKKIIDANNYFLYEYANKNLTKITVKSGNATTIIDVSYNNINQLNKLDLNGPNVSYTTSFTYINNRLASLVKKHADNTQDIATFTYNANDKISKIVVNHGNGQFNESADFTYGPSTMTVKRSTSSKDDIFTFDTKNNPLKNVDKNIILTAFVLQGEIFPENLNTENNILKEVSGNTIYQNNSYNYDSDDFPITQTDLQNSYSLTFEYLKL